LMNDTQSKKSAATVIKARKSLGLNIAEMVRLCDVPRSTWDGWERGERAPDRAALRLLEVLVLLHRDDRAAYRRFADATARANKQGEE